MEQTDGSCPGTKLAILRRETHIEMNMNWKANNNNNTHTHTISSTAPTYAPHSHPLDLWTDPAGVMELLARWRDKLAGGPKAGWSGLPPQTRVKGVGRYNNNRIRRLYCWPTMHWGNLSQAMQHQSGAPTQVIWTLRRYRQRRMRLWGRRPGTTRWTVLTIPHQESFTLRAKDHSDMLSAQYPVNCLDGGGQRLSWHHKPRPRPIKETLHSRHHSLFFLDLAQAGWKATRICTHTHTVDSVFNSKETTEYWLNVHPQYRTRNRD